MLLAVALAALVAGLLVGLNGGGGRRLLPGGGNASGTFDPLAYSADRAATLQTAAAAGYSHVIYAKSPGGVVASARRTARFRSQVDAAAQRGAIDPGTLEAIVMLESAGRPDVVAGPDPSAASGLTQIVAQTGSQLLGMRVDLAASRRLAAQIAAAQAAGRTALAARLSARRARVDQRFDPRAALAGAVRYLTLARRIFGRDDLAVESYHMGIGNLEMALRLYAGPGHEHQPIAQLVAGQGLSYAKLYLDSTPIHHAAAYGLLSALGDDSASYLWRVAAAREIMSLYRANPTQLARQAALQTSAPSAARVLRPLGTATFATPAAVSAALADGGLVPVPSGAGALTLGVQAPTPAALRPDALRVALYITSGVHYIARAATPLQLTAATTAVAELAAAARVSNGLADSDPIHATGYAFDIARSYSSPAQAQAFQFMLDRLQALDIIAWDRRTRIIHIVTGPGASELSRVRFSAG